MRHGLTLILLLLCTGAHAQEAATPEETPALAPVRPADLTTALWRVDRALRRQPPTDGETWARRNQAFDRLASCVFTGELRRMVRGLDDLLLAHLGEESPAARLALSLRVSLEPEVITTGANPRARVRSLYRVEGATPVELTLQVRGPDGVLTSWPLPVQPDEAGTVTRELELVRSGEPLPPGRHELELQTPGGRCISVGWLRIARELPSATRDRLRRRAEGLEEVPGLAQALVSCRARIELLTDTPTEAAPAQLLLDPVPLREQLERELALLEQGQDPYVGCGGDLWRVFLVGPGELAVRLYAPPAALGTAPVPLLVALHGAGGNESLYLEAHGQGRLRELAEAHGLLLLCPDTAALQLRLPHLLELVDAVAGCYPVDRDRVYLLGHSLGARVAGRAAQQHPGRIAAACCIAGAPLLRAGSPCAPLLVLQPEEDGVTPAELVRLGVERAAAAGLPVELRLVPHQGHTLGLPSLLPEAVAWLLEHEG